MNEKSLGQVASLEKASYCGFSGLGIISIAMLFFYHAPPLSFSVALISGFNHPFQGWDHIVTMIAVGIWAEQMRGNAVWHLPLAFVMVMTLGGMLGVVSALSSLEPVILLSCLTFCLLIAGKVRFSSWINVRIVAFFVFFMVTRTDRKFPLRVFYRYNCSCS